MSGRSSMLVIRSRPGRPRARHCLRRSHRLPHVRRDPADLAGGWGILAALLRRRREYSVSVSLSVTITYLYHESLLAVWVCIVGQDTILGFLVQCHSWVRGPRSIVRYACISPGRPLSSPRLCLSLRRRGWGLAREKVDVRRSQ